MISGDILASGGIRASFSQGAGVSPLGSREALAFMPGRNGVIWAIK